MRQRGRDGALLRSPSSASSSGNGRRTPSTKTTGRSAAKKKRRVDDGTSPAIAGKLKVDKEEKKEEEEEEGGGEEEKLLRDRNSGEAGNKETVAEDKEDKEEKEEEKDEEEEDGEEGEEEEEEGEERERVKLDEGFYEVEEIRGKRTRKGKSQYLVKWQGWPMSANTWEPIDNLIICKDLVDEFEKSSHAGKQGKRGRGKRKSNVVPRKKSHSSSFEEGSGDIEFGKDGEGQIDRQVLLDDAKQRSPLTPEVPNLVVSDRLGKKDSKELNTSSKEGGNGTGVTVDNNSTYVRDVAMVEALGDDPLLLACDPHQGLIEEGAKSSPPVSSLVSLEEVPTDGVKSPSPFENNHLEQASPLSNKKAGVEETVKHASVDKCSGARKRKQGCVRRVPQSVDSEEPQEKRESNEEQIKEMQHVSPESKHAYNVGDSGSWGPQMLNETFGNQILVEETKACDFSAPVPELPETTTPPPILITEIIKAVSYTNTTSNGKQNVTVGFKVLRSDGEEVMVDNKFLRAKFPMLLIDFYEQHLRYSV